MSLSLGAQLHCDADCTLAIVKSIGHSHRRINSVGGVCKCTTTRLKFNIQRNSVEFFKKKTIFCLILLDAHSVSMWLKVMKRHGCKSIWVLRISMNRIGIPARTANENLAQVNQDSSK
ncbi:uncharacterized protein LOC125765189 [Anopheles funestus]|uniref:uncharacterized protein LOC125765189 n=1 Tax=Anopheles funestus TaxID=62324 RepID=UPI0020C72E25|nr:uncharacterized protein LOC125765189 [Anopheles funestus]